MNLKINLIAAAALLALQANAQVPQTTIVEHFTNTSCGVCAGTNGTIYTTLQNYNSALHISFHPSAPYTSDFFSQQNKAENDGRTNYYGIFGATPRLVLNGVSTTSGSLNAGLSNTNSLTSNFSIQLTQVQFGTDSFTVDCIIKKVAADTNTTAMLFTATAEDTVNQATNNGETVHYNVFRKTLSAITGNTITLPTTIGDSIVQTYNYKAGAAWTTTHAIAILQKSNKAVINSAKSINSKYVTTPNNLQNSIVATNNLLYPNPAINSIVISELAASKIEIYTLNGVLAFSKTNVPAKQTIDISSMPSGIYNAYITNANGNFVQKIIK